MSESVTQLVISDGVATVTLNRPQQYNVLNAEMTRCLLETLHAINGDQSVRLVVLTANGTHFCAGADLKWMAATPTHQQPACSSIGLQLAELMHTLYHLRKPTIVVVNGLVYGGGIGLVACCDIALASRGARFCFSEVRLGLIPAVISPYIVNAIGARAARRYLLTAERFSAQRAFDMGLIHEVLADNQLQRYTIKLSQNLIAAGPCALARTKQLLDDVVYRQLDDAIKVDTATWLTQTCDTPESREGISAFLEKRSPDWVNTHRNTT